MYSLVRSQRATAHTLQNVSEVNKERSRLAAASSVCDSTKHNSLVTFEYQTFQVLGWLLYITFSQIVILIQFIIKKVVV